MARHFESRTKKDNRPHAAAQTRALSIRHPDSGPGELSAGRGEPLDQGTRGLLESRLGHDFSDVRVHDDSSADRLARDLDARAFAFGDELFFRGGEFAPDSPDGLRLLAHETAHTLQQVDPAPMSSMPIEIGARDSGLEGEARAAEQAVLGAPSLSPVSVSQSAASQIQCWPWDEERRPEEAGGGGLVDSIGGLASGAAQAVGGAASFAYDGYQKATDFKSLQKGNAKLADESKGSFGEGFIRGGINGEIDAVENMAAANNQKMVDDAQGHWYSGLAQGSAWVNNAETQVAGGLLKGVGDIGFGLANGIAHPIDAAGGLLGIAEHNLFGAGSVLKAGHGLVDLGLDAAGVHYEGQGEYGKSFGELGNHLFNPLQQMEDDQKFNTNLLQGIVDPDKKGWDGLKDKPIETVTRALTNIAPVALGVGEAAGAGEAAGGVRPVGVVEPAPPTLRSPALPEGVPAPTPFNPEIPTVTPGGPSVPGFRTPSLPPDIIPGPDTLPSPGVEPPATVRAPTPTQPGLGPATQPGLGPIDLPPDTIPQSRPRTPTQPGLGPQDPGTQPGPISDPLNSQFELDLDPVREGRGKRGPGTADSEALRGRPDSSGPASDLSPMSPRQPPPTPSVEELLEGLEERKGFDSPQVSLPDSSPSISELLRRLL